MLKNSQKDLRGCKGFQKILYCSLHFVDPWIKIKSYPTKKIAFHIHHRCCGVFFSRGVKFTPYNVEILLGGKVGGLGGK